MMGKTRTGVDYWPRLIWQWISTSYIVEIIAGKRQNHLKRKDQRNAWRITHASVAACGLNKEMDAKMCMQVLTILKQRKFGLTLYSAKDRDGDTPLHSVVKTADLRRLNILLDHLPPELLSSTLEMANKLGQTPLKVAFDQEEWEMMERLLEYCIQNRLCSDLTGIGENLQGSKTLLHHAMEKGTDCRRFLEMYFDLTTSNREYGKLGLLVCDEKGRTPWFYLMNHKDPRILESVLCTLKHHGIDINELTTDKFSRSTMLHLAYRKKRQECIQLLVDAGAEPGKKDTRGLRADQRDHWIGGSRKVCEEVARNQQQVPPAEPGLQSDVQQEMNSDEEAVEEETSLSVLNPNHLLCAGPYSSQPDHKVPPHDSSCVHTTEELLPSSILPFSAQCPAVSDVSSPAVPPSVPPPSESVPSVPPPSLYHLLSFLLSLSSIPPQVRHLLHHLQYHLLHHPLYVVLPSVTPYAPFSIPPCVLPYVPPPVPSSVAPSLPPSSVAPSAPPPPPTPPSLYHLLYQLLYYLLYHPLCVSPSVPLPVLPPAPPPVPPPAPPPVQPSVPPPAPPPVLPPVPQ